MFFIHFNTFIKMELDALLNLESCLWWAFSGRIGLPPAVMGWAASCNDGP